MKIFVLLLASSFIQCTRPAQSVLNNESVVLSATYLDGGPIPRSPYYPQDPGEVTGYEQDRSESYKLLSSALHDYEGQSVGVLVYVVGNSNKTAGRWATNMTKADLENLLPAISRNYSDPCHSEDVSFDPDGGVKTASECHAGHFTGDFGPDGKVSPGSACGVLGQLQDGGACEYEDCLYGAPNETGYPLCPKWIPPHISIGGPAGATCKKLELKCGSHECLETGPDGCDRDCTDASTPFAVGIICIDRDDAGAK